MIDEIWKQTDSQGCLVRIRFLRCHGTISLQKADLSPYEISMKGSAVTRNTELLPITDPDRLGDTQEGYHLDTRSRTRNP